MMNEPTPGQQAASQVDKIQALARADEDGTGRITVAPGVTLVCKYGRVARNGVYVDRYAWSLVTPGGRESCKYTRVVDLIREGIEARHER